MMDIREIFATSLHRADRILSLMALIDGDACVALHGYLMARICESRVHPLEAAFVLTNVMADVLSFLDDDTQRKLAEDIPELIDLARERIEEDKLAAP